MVLDRFLPTVRALAIGLAQLALGSVAVLLRTRAVGLGLARFDTKFVLRASLFVRIL